MIRAGTAKEVGNSHHDQPINADQIRATIIRVRKKRSEATKKSPLMSLSQLGSRFCKLSKVVFGVSCMGVGSAISSHAQLRLVRKLIDYSALDDEELEGSFPLHQLLMTSAMAVIGPQISKFGQEIILRTYFPDDYLVKKDNHIAKNSTSK